MTESWFEHVGAEADIAVSTRVRLARNVGGRPFPAKQSAEQAEKTAALLAAPITDNPVTAEKFRLLKISGMSEVERVSLVERHLISPDLAKKTRDGALLLSDDGGISIMFNEEDHMRLQVLGTGLCPRECLDTALIFDRMVAEGLASRGEKYAYSEELGFLTQCPTNLGTGLRVSVMLHLPALASSGGMQPLSELLGKLGVAVRGFYGEGSKGLGDLFQISNQITLGKSEKELAASIEDVVTKTIAEERASRGQLLERSAKSVEDKVCRAEALLKSARVMPAEEAMRLISDLRLGISLGLLEGDIKKTNALLTGILPATLSLHTGGLLPPGERDISRAKMIREVLT